MNKQQPTGLPSDRNSKTGAATAWTFGAIADIVYSLKMQYRRRAVWLVHRNSIATLSKMKTTGDGQPLFIPSLATGNYDRLWGHDIIESEWVPSEIANTKIAGYFGDLSHYWIVDSHGFELQRLIELYAETNEVGLIMRSAHDGAFTQPEACRRLVYGA